MKLPKLTREQLLWRWKMQRATKGATGRHIVSEEYKHKQETSKDVFYKTLSFTHPEIAEGVRKSFDAALALKYFLCVVLGFSDEETPVGFSRNGVMSIIIQDKASIHLGQGSSGDIEIYAGGFARYQDALTWNQIKQIYLKEFTEKKKQQFIERLKQLGIDIPVSELN